MANRRQRLARKAEREREQIKLDELASELVLEGLPVSSRGGVIPSARTALSFSIEANLNGSDLNHYWPNQLGWLQHRHQYEDWTLKVKGPIGMQIEDIAVRVRPGVDRESITLTESEFLRRPDQVVEAMLESGKYVTTPAVWNGSGQ